MAACNRVMLAIMFWPLSLLGQSKTWDSLAQLTPGTPISVVVRARIECNFLAVDSAELTCERQESGRHTVYPRRKVREFRLEYPEHNAMRKGIIVGAVAGGVMALLGATQLKDPEARGYSGFYGVPIGAFLGAGIGRHIHRHGPVIYESK